MRPAASAIPRLIHRIWLGGDPPPAAVEYGEAWARLHPGWTLRTWSDETLPRLDLQASFDAARSPAMAADIARVELLYRFGGVYVDVDFEPLRTIDDLLTGVQCFAASEDGRWVSTGIMGSVPGHPFLGRLLERLPGSIAARPWGTPNQITGPQFVTAQYLAYRKLAGAPPVVVFPPSLFYPYHFSEPGRRDGPFPDAYAVHHWWDSWKDAD